MNMIKRVVQLLYQLIIPNEQQKPACGACFNKLKAVINLKEKDKQMVICFFF